ncbi:hypothetical protein AWC38_SpisGene19420 [Stylophora pistillata]|uniref:Fibronectin type-III domain-containing protein n=1 Tax=Stylophora pistillata TaxID=50429 RepID=A0A2B4RD78_STYPI|nr:hypothetical protein AWC38_SpisGene19420 [Stylophora pistillata]
MVKHIFGATSSPSVVNLCLKKTAMMGEQQDSGIANFIDRNMYVDDLMKSTETAEDAISLAKEISKQLNKGGFHITKWCSNDRRVIAAVPESERATTVAKLILQILSRMKIGWDEPLEENENEQWTRWLDDLGKLRKVTVDRCLKPKGLAQVKEIQLHLFSHSSRQGYSAAAYFRVKDVDGRLHCSFVMGKARLAPIREISRPRLELTAAGWIYTQQWRYVNREYNPADDGSKRLKLDVLVKNDRWLTESFKISRTPPSSPTIVVLGENGAQVSLEWELSDAPNNYFVQFWRKKTSDNLKQITSSTSGDALNPSSTSEFKASPPATLTLKNVERNEEYSYTITLLNSDAVEVARDHGSVDEAECNSPSAVISSSETS